MGDGRGGGHDGAQQERLCGLSPRCMQHHRLTWRTGADLDVDAQARHALDGRGTSTSSIVPPASTTTAAERPMTLDRELRPACSRLRDERLRRAPPGRRCRPAGSRGEGHERAARAEAGPADGLGGRLVGHRGREELFERGVVEAAPRGALVPEPDAVDRGRRRQALDDQLVEWAPGHPRPARASTRRSARRRRRRSRRRPRVRPRRRSRSRGLAAASP